MEEIYGAHPVQVPAADLWTSEHATGHTAGLRAALTSRVDAALLVALLDAGRRPGPALKVAELLTPVVVDLITDPHVRAAAQLLAEDQGKDATKEGCQPRQSVAYSNHRARTVRNPE